MKKLIFIALILFFQTSAYAAIHSETVEYQDGDAVLQGYLAYDDALQGPLPGVLIVHEWTGLGSYVKRRAQEIAGLDYVAFAADIYGKGIRPKNQEEAAVQAGIYKKDRALMRRRVNAGLQALEKDPRVDRSRLAAIGYCFGGTTVLELARSGADVRGVVSFHGGLDSLAPEDAKNIKAKVLVLHGADDPLSPPKDVAAFQDELRKAGVDYQFVFYGGAVHSFTNPDAGNDPSKGAAYNASADRRSWEAMKQFLMEIFATKGT
jgi:dienelactone hydrolase